MATVLNSEQTSVAWPKLEASAQAPDLAYNAKLADQAIIWPQAAFEQRGQEILQALATFLAMWLYDAIFSYGKLSHCQRNRLCGQRLRHFFSQLGPAFIKVGQFLSSRGDLLPPEIVQELSYLQDKVLPLPMSQVSQIVSNELCAPIGQTFIWFEETPLASASIGQVHRARLKDGLNCVVKVQRPALKQTFYKDLGYLRACAKLACLFGGKQKSEFLLDLSDQFGKTLFEEIDYLNEGLNAESLRKFFRYRPQIKIARIFWKHSTRRVLVSEYLPGIKISDRDKLQQAGINLGSLAKLVVDFYAEQFLFSDCYHADPHPGNLASDEDGNLIVYDFGMVGVIKQSQKKALVDCIFSVVNKDGQHFATALIELGIVAKHVNKELLTKCLEPFISYWSGKDLDDLSFSEIENNVDKLLGMDVFRLPSNLAYLVRAGTCAEGAVRVLKPKFNFARALKPYLGRWAIASGLDSKSPILSLNLQ